MHTHASDGIIHMEAPKQMTFTLGEFFDIWGEKLSTDAGRARARQGDGARERQGRRRATRARSRSRTHELIQLDVGTPLVGEQKVGFAKL